MKVCKRTVYTGNVQGVGFRYTTQGIARHYPVGGYVRNMPDGTVEVVAEGEPAEVDAFVKAILSRMNHYIDSHSVMEIDPKDFDGFDIRY